MYLICPGLNQSSLKLSHDPEYICENTMLEYFI